MTTMTATTQQTSSTPLYAPREAILHSAEFLKKTIAVKGTVVLADPELGRVDISHQGAKLIVHWNDKEMPKLQQTIVVTGILRKEQRRTFLVAKEIDSCEN